jgi:hypothetical protein
MHAAHHFGSNQRRLGDNALQVHLTQYREH